MKRILITGGMGFVGSNLGLALKSKYPDYAIIAFDNLKRRGAELNLSRLKEKGIQFIHGDIRNKSDFSEVGSVDLVIDAAAEPSVLAGINGSPEYLIDTNLNGTINSLYFANQHKADFVFLSTSRIYPIEQIEKIKFTEAETRFRISDEQTLPGISTRGIAENFPLEGARSYYGATKLASELFVTEFQKYSNIRTVINRCGVLAGPWQMGKVDQGVTVLWVAKHFWKQPLSYIGFDGLGKQVRDALHILDLFNLIDWQIHHMDKINGEIFNVGGGVDCSFSLLELTNLCQKVTGNTVPIASVKETRNADIRLYLTDNSKVSKVCHWKPFITPLELVTQIYQWLRENESNLAPILK